MAIDSREKRQSVIGIHYSSSVSPTSNASPDQEWRQQAGYGYSGILAASPTGANLLDYERGYGRGMAVGAARGIG